MTGQAVSCFEQAVRAEMLGKRGRYFMISEDDIEKLAARDRELDDYDQ